MNGSIIASIRTSPTGSSGPRVTLATGVALGRSELVVGCVVRIPATARHGTRYPVVGGPVVGAAPRLAALGPDGADQELQG